MWEKNGLLWVAKIMIGSPTLYGARLVAFKEALAGTGNDHTFDPASVCDFPGYADIPFSWAVAPFINGDGKGEAETGIMTFTRNEDGTAQNIEALGIVIFTGHNTGAVDELLWYDDSFTTAIMEFNGDTFSRKIKFGDDTLTVAP